MPFQTTRWKITSTKAAKFAWRQFGRYILTIIMPLGKPCTWRISETFGGANPGWLPKLDGQEKSMGEAMRTITERVVLLETIKNV